MSDEDTELGLDVPTILQPLRVPMPSSNSSCIDAISRRSALQSIAAFGALSATGLLPNTAKAKSDSGSKIKFSLNTSTIRGHKLKITESITKAAAAGYDQIEPWMRELEEYISSGGKLSDLKQQLQDNNLQVVSAIGFPSWVVDDNQQRTKGIEQLKHDMEILAQLDAPYIAAPPMGVHQGNAPPLDLNAAAERYHHILELGKEFGVTPQVEIWGPAKNMSKIAEAAYIAIAANHPNAGILPDVYHLYRGGSDFHGLELLAGCGINLFHFNDYPKTDDRTKLNDGDRVYPGHGVAPWSLICDILKQMNFQGTASLELFNKQYWAQPADQVMADGLKSMKTVLAPLL